MGIESDAGTLGPVCVARASAMRLSIILGSILAFGFRRCFPGFSFVVSRGLPGSCEALLGEDLLFNFLRLVSFPVCPLFVGCVRGCWDFDILGKAEIGNEAVG